MLAEPKNVLLINKRNGSSINSTIYSYSNKFLVSTGDKLSIPKVTLGWGQNLHHGKISNN